MKKSVIAHYRLHNQHIGTTPFEKPSDVVSWLVAVQAQDYAGAKWALGLRMQNATDESLDQAFNDGAILRTHLMRPTWHFVTPADIRWMLRLSAPRVHAVNATMYRRQGLDSVTLKRSQAVLAKALQGNKQLTRDELRDELQAAGIPVDGGLRLALIMMAAELDGVICNGPRRGKQFTYALLEERAPDAKTLTHEESLAELARRYFMSRGPASVQDMAKWSGLTVADSRLGLEAVKAQLECETIDGQTYWFSTSTLFGNNPSPTAHLLSIFDEYIAGYKDRSAIVEDKLWAKLTALGNGLRYVIVIDGQIVGTWRRVLKKDSVNIEFDPFIQLTKTENKAVTLAAQRYGEFLELPVILL